MGFGKFGLNCICAGDDGAKVECHFPSRAEGVGDNFSLSVHTGFTRIIHSASHSLWTSYQWECAGVDVRNPIFQTQGVSIAGVLGLLIFDQLLNIVTAFSPYGPGRIILSTTSYDRSASYGFTLTRNNDTDAFVSYTKNGAEFASETVDMISKGFTPCIGGYYFVGGEGAFPIVIINSASGSFSY